jgi:Xaa-Pro dipeptidase
VRELGAGAVDDPLRVEEHDGPAAVTTRRIAASMDIIAGILRPNLPVRELNEAVKSYFEEQGLWESRGWIGGYEMGIAFAPDWVGNFVYDPQSDDNGERVFEPGTSVNYENQFFMPGHVGQYFTITSLLFTEAEGRMLSDMPFELIVTG